MKKIGIITMHKVKNYGSFLQAYALKNLIKNDDNEVVFVDFATKNGQYGIVEEKPKTRLVLKIKKILLNILARIPLLNKQKKLKVQNNFINFQKLSKTQQKDIDKLGTCVTDKEKLDLLIIGSDEVFNYKDNNYFGYSDELFGDKIETKQLITFSACFGSTTMDYIKENNKQELLSNYLKRFDAISVRDKNSYDIVKELIGVDAFYNIDPVLYYDYKKELIEPKIKKPYIIIYSYSGMGFDRADQIKSFAKNNNLQIITIMGYQGSLGKFVNASAFEVLGLFKNASYVYTSTFHGAILSIKYNKNFCVDIFNKVNNGYTNHFKLYDLIKRMELEDRIVGERKLEEIWGKEINFDFTNDYIKRTIEQGKEFLKNFI